MLSKREHDKRADYVCKFDFTPSLAQGELGHSPTGIPALAEESQTIIAEQIPFWSKYSTNPSPT